MRYLYAIGFIIVGVTIGMIGLWIWMLFNFRL